MTTGTYTCRSPRWALWPGTAVLAIALAPSARILAADAYPLDKEGFVRHWLVAGPYPNPQAEPEPKGFTDDLLKHRGGEAKVIPYAGLRDEAAFVADKAKLIAGIGSTNVWGFRETRRFAVTWTPLHWEDDEPIIKLDGRFGEIRDWLAAFAACWIDSPSDRDVQLRVGSDDGYKLYLNHELVGGFTTSRAAARDQNVHPGRLRRGLNLLLLKVTDRIGGHAFCLRVTDKKARPYEDLRVLVDHPRMKFAARCKNLDEVDVVDREGFAKIRLGREPRFPGKMPVSIMLGLSDARECRVTVLVTDGGDREVLSREFTARLTPTNALPIEATVSIEHAGPAKVGVLVKDVATAATVAHLSRAFNVLDLAAVRRQRDTLRRELTDRDARRTRLEKELAKQQERLAALRGEIARQHGRIEATYARRREALAKRHGEKGRSVDVPFAPEASPRETLCINGDNWEIAGAISQGGYQIEEQTPPKDGWEPGWVPMVGVEKYFRPYFFPAEGDGGRYKPTKVMKCAPEGWRLSDARIGDGIWYRTTVDVPERWRGRRILFTTEYAAHRVKVFLDGRLAGEHEGWPGEIEIELPRVEPGEHELLVLAQRARSYGGGTTRLNQCFGLLGDVCLTTVADATVRHTWVITSWRGASIEARVWLLNRGKKTRTVTVSGRMVLSGRTRLDLGKQEAKLAPGVVEEVRFRRPWTDPEPWGIGGQYGKPVLYHLVTTVTDGEQVLDQHFTRFGFREFWKAGFHFYLNGKRIFIQGDNVGTRITSRPYQVVWQNLMRSHCNVNAIRTHFELQQGMYARVADELGMLILPQWYPNLFVKGRSMKSPKGQALSVEEFLTTEEHGENLRLYARWVKWLRNHPSVIVYCTDNEIFTQAWDTPDKLESNIRNDRLGAVYGQYVKALDPTRLVTRDGDEGTWGKMGKWQEDPPADMANYHYPDFNAKKLVENWESLYEKPVLFGETLYCSYGAWDGWIDAIPSQVAGKAERCCRILLLYRDLEVSGWVGMGPGLDCFTELKDDGSGNPWGITPAMRDRHKASGQIPERPRYPYFPIEWPSLSGPGFKPEFHRFKSSYGYGSVNAYFPDLEVCVPNAVNAAYKECTRPMPPVSPHRPTEVLITVAAAGKPVPFATVVLTPRAGQACSPVGVRADREGRAWLVLHEAGRYLASVEGASKQMTVDVKRVPFALRAGFDYLPRITLEVAQ